MSIIDAIIMGIIQGLAEFLPISSSGHLAIFRHILDLELEQGVLFEVLLHLGTLVAVFIVYYKEIVELIVQGIRLLGRIGLAIVRKIQWKEVVDVKEHRFILMVLITMIPTLIIALIMKDRIETAFDSLLIPGIGLFITAGLLIVSDRFTANKYDEKNASYTSAIVVGIAQGFATFPGISRSGSTIVAGRTMGYNKEFATRFSFIMSIPAIIGANILSLAEADFSTISSSDWTAYLVGTFFSAVVGYICIRTLLAIIRKNKLHYFAYYCMLAGGLSLFTYFLA